MEIITEHKQLCNHLEKIKSNLKNIVFLYNELLNKIEKEEDKLFSSSSKIKMFKYHLTVYKTNIELLNHYLELFSSKYHIH